MGPLVNQSLRRLIEGPLSGACIVVTAGTCILQSFNTFAQPNPKLKMPTPSVLATSPPIEQVNPGTPVGPGPKPQPPVRRDVTRPPIASPGDSGAKIRR